MIKAVKGTRDLMPPATAIWNHVETAAREVFRRHHYQEIRTPIFEVTDLFARGVGADTDIVTKEMYTFADRDREATSLTLRPENTAPVMRSYIQYRLDQQPGLQRLFYIGPMFRRERPQKGRYRQFYQIGAECIGTDSPVVDAEVIEMVWTLLDAAGLEDRDLLLNSVGCPRCRPAYVALLRKELEMVAAGMCGNCRRRAVTNPLRVLDCKVPEDQEIIAGLPTILDHLCEECRRHFAYVRGCLDQVEIAYRINPRMVRGLDYYTRTTFEVVSGALGAQNSVVGGGRYDGLAEQLGSRVAAPGIGFSIGEDRLVLILEELRGATFVPTLDVLLAPLGEVEAQHSVVLARELREAGAAVEIAPPDKLRKLLDLANKRRARFTLIVGEKELASGAYALKDMESGEQVELGRDEIKSRLSSNV